MIPEAQYGCHRLHEIWCCTTFEHSSVLISFFIVLDLQPLSSSLPDSIPFLPSSPLSLLKCKFTNGCSSLLHASTKHRCQWSHSRPSTGKCHLKGWYDMEDILAVFSFWIKFPLERATLKFFQDFPLSSGKLWQQEKTSSFLALHLLAQWNWIGRDYGFDVGGNTRRHTKSLPGTE